MHCKKKFANSFYGNMSATPWLQGFLLPLTLLTALNLVPTASLRRRISIPAPSPPGSSARQSQGEQACVPPRLHPGYLCFERSSSLSITPRVNHCVISFHPHHNLMREDSIFSPILQMRTLRHRRDEDLLTLPQLGVNKQVLPMFNLSPHLPWF